MDLVFAAVAIPRPICTGVAAKAPMRLGYWMYACELIYIKTCWSLAIPVGSVDHVHWHLGADALSSALFSPITCARIIRDLVSIA